MNVFVSRHMQDNQPATPPAPPPAQRFEIDQALRRKQLWRMLLRVPGGLVLGITPSLIGGSRINYPLLAGVFGVGLLLILLVCRGRSAWGTALEFQEPRIEFYRGEEKLLSIPRQSLRRVRLKKQAVTLDYTLGGPLKFKVIGNEGFTTEQWEALGKEMADYGKQAGVRVDS